MRFNIGPDEATAIADVKASIDAEADKLRAAHVTPGMEMTYILQEQEARRIVSGEKYLQREVPHVVAEAHATGVKIEAAAALIVQRADETRQALAKIKGQVRKAKLAVDAGGSISNARRIAARAFRKG